MKFKITRENLQRGLAAVAASIPTRTTLPVLSNILIDVDGDSVGMSGTDLDTATIRSHLEPLGFSGERSPARVLRTSPQ